MVNGLKQAQFKDLNYNKNPPVPLVKMLAITMTLLERATILDDWNKLLSSLKNFNLVEEMHAYDRQNLNEEMIELISLDDCLPSAMQKGGPTHALSCWIRV